jgi:pilus assembly protein Flp/PilA
MKLFRRFLACDRGATAIEYALIAAVIGLGILTGAQTLKNAVDAKYQNVSSGVNAIN